MESVFLSVAILNYLSTTVYCPSLRPIKFYLIYCVFKQEVWVVLWWNRKLQSFNPPPLKLQVVCVCCQTGLVLCDTNSKVYNWEMLPFPPSSPGDCWLLMEGCEVTQRRK